MKFFGKTKTSNDNYKTIKQFSLYVLKMQEEAKWQKVFSKSMLLKDLKL